MQQLNHNLVLSSMNENVHTTLMDCRYRQPTSCRQQLNEGLLTNSEVRTLLLEKKADQREGEVVAVPSEKKVYEYLATYSRATATAEKIGAFKETAIDVFHLTEAEALQLINLCPDSELEIPLVVEQCEERLNEQQIEQLVQILKESFG